MYCMGGPSESYQFLKAEGFLRLWSERCGRRESGWDETEGKITEILHVEEDWSLLQAFEYRDSCWLLEDRGSIS